MSLKSEAWQTYLELDFLPVFKFKAPENLDPVVWEADELRKWEENTSTKKPTWEVQLARRKAEHKKYYERLERNKKGTAEPRNTVVLNADAEAEPAPKKARKPKGGALPAPVVERKPAPPLELTDPIRKLIQKFCVELSAQECPVCNRQFGESDDPEPEAQDDAEMVDVRCLVITSCGHFLCRNCADDIEGNKCPMCRKEEAW